MANYGTIFKAPDGNYGVAYTSEPYFCNRQGDNVRGIFQIQVTAGDVTIEGRLAEDAPWVSLKTYTEDAMETIDMPYQLRVVTTGADSRVWVAETV